MTPLYDTHIREVSEETITHAADLIRSGAVVAFPTETVYGLGANALDSAAVARIFEAKGRPSTDPLIVHVLSEVDLRELVTGIPPQVSQAIADCWPGPLTFVLPRTEKIPDLVSAGLDTVAVRSPSHPVARALIRAAGVPIAAPSANRFGHTSPTTAQHVYADLAGRIPLILDGGATTIGVESTILMVEGDRARLLRPGAVPVSVLRRYWPDLEIVSRYAQVEEGAVPAPGMLLKHYSPRAEVRLYDGTDEAVRTALREAVTTLSAQGQRVGLLVADDDLDAVAALDVPTVALGPLSDLEQVAQRLFAGLRELDATGVTVILARLYPPEGIGLAIRDRLIRAAEGRITKV